MNRNTLVWRRLRQVSQAIFFVGFVYLFVHAISGGQQAAWSDLFYRFDPLVALTASLAGRVVIGGLLLSLVTVALTLIFGRVWCGWICPMGSLLDWISPPKKKLRRQKTVPEQWRTVKYVLLVVIVFAAALGNQSLLVFDPLTIVTRTFTTALWPALRQAVDSLEGFLYQFESLWDGLDWFHQSVVIPLFEGVNSYFGMAVPIFLFFAGIVALNWVARRFWCRYLCPLGGLLGWLSRFALLRRDVGGACASCALCGHDCPTGTIDPAKGYRSDPAECVVCCDCIVDCSREGVAFRWQLPRWKVAQAQPYDPKRRQVLAALGGAAAGVALAGVEPILKRQPADMVRPPGAKLVDFDSLCIRCGECLRVCPTQGLQPTLLEGGWQNMLTPRLVPRLGYCDYNCIACSEACPSGAIPLLGLAEKQVTSIGLARVDTDRCLPWAYNTICSVCEEACPLPEKAIRQVEVEVVTLEGETLQLKRPYVLRELCIGCGICEHQCPMGGEAAIRVYAHTESELLPGGLG